MSNKTKAVPLERNLCLTYGGTMFTCVDMLNVDQKDLTVLREGSLFTGWSGRQVTGGGARQIVQPAKGGGASQIG